MHFKNLIIISTMRNLSSVDHKPLKYLLQSPLQNKKIQLWALGIAGYNCIIEYIAGTENTCIDLLSRKPDGVGVNEALDSFDLDISDNTFEVGIINSNEIGPKDFAGCIIPEIEQIEVPKCDLPGLNMIVEQAKDKDITDLKTTLEQGNPSQAVKRRYIIEQNIVYFLSDPDYNPTLRLFVPGHLLQTVVKQYHDVNGHMGVQKSYDSIRPKCFLPNLFQDMMNMFHRVLNVRQDPPKKLSLRFRD